MWFAFGDPTRDKMVFLFVNHPQLHIATVEGGKCLQERHANLRNRGEVCRRLINENGSMGSAGKSSYSGQGRDIHNRKRHRLSINQGNTSATAACSSITSIG